MQEAQGNCTETRSQDGILISGDACGVGRGLRRLTRAERARRKWHVKHQPLEKIIGGLDCALQPRGRGGKACVMSVISVLGTAHSLVERIAQDLHGGTAK